MTNTGIMWVNVITGLTRLLTKNSRNTDIIACWDGEEFIVLCPHTYIDGAKITVEKLHLAIREHMFINSIYVTVSFGDPKYELRIAVL
ncbi:MAG: diguanylate cyclase [Gammaproteobacteria bacterium]|nr:diguanylate cyclase [Gammaproteobacteria bacterium]